MGKLRAQELAALAETIKVLNDDDALELFKKTLPSASASLLQIGSTMTSLRARASLELSKVLKTAPLADRAHLDLISMALHGKKIGFEKVIQMIDELVATLKQEQIEDNNKKTYCQEELDANDDKKKALTRAVSDEESAIAD